VFMWSWKKRNIQWMVWVWSKW